MMSPVARPPAGIRSPRKRLRATRAPVAQRDVSAWHHAEQLPGTSGSNSLEVAMHIVTWLVLGHSSLGTELLQQLEEMGEDLPLSSLLVPAGGGGLVAGISVALRSHGSPIRLIAVEPEGYDDLARSLSAGQRQRDGAPSPTLCDDQAVRDGLPVRKCDTNAPSVCIKRIVAGNYCHLLPV